MSATRQAGSILPAGMVRIGPGTLVAVCGPSGAGKDTLIARARALSAGERNVAFPLRVVTRATTGHEDHESMSEVEFDRAKDEGAFAFWWAAHGLKYGVPADVDGDLASGRCVVCNVSRTVLPALKERYARVLAVLVTAPPEVLAVRLGERGRASDGSIAERMARTAALAGTFSPDIVIENVGPPDRGAKVLIGAIASQFPVFSI